MKSIAQKYGDEWNCVPQGEQSLGQRMSRAVQDAFDAGVTRVVVIRADCPDTTPSNPASAFDALDEHSFVIGPATGGEAYLSELRRLVPPAIREHSLENRRRFPSNV